MARELSELLRDAAGTPQDRPDMAATWRRGRRQARLRTVATSTCVALLLVATVGVARAALLPRVQLGDEGPTATDAEVADAQRVGTGPGGAAVTRCWELGSGWRYTESVEPDGRVSGNALTSPPTSSAPDATTPDRRAQSPDGTILEDNGWASDDARLLVRAAVGGVEGLRRAGVTGTDAELESRRIGLRERLEDMQRCVTIEANVDGQVVRVPPAPARAAVTGTLLRRGDCLVVQRADGLTAALAVEGLVPDLGAGWLIEEEEGDRVAAAVGDRVRARGEVTPVDLPDCPAAEVVIVAARDLDGLDPPVSRLPEPGITVPGTGPTATPSP